MSEGVSALSGAVWDGFARVEETGLRGMVTLRGDLQSQAMKDAVKAVAGTDLPAHGSVEEAGERAVCWMAPDEILIFLPRGDAAEAVESLSEKLSGEHHLVADVSDARAVFAVSGAGAREVLAKLTPADLHPAAFGPGTIRRTRLAQVAAGVWMRDQHRFEVFCFRSQATYLFDVLKASAQPGSGVGYF